MIFLGCILWLLICGYCVFLVQWTIGGDIDLVTGILGIALYMGCGISVFAPPAPGIAPVCAIAVLASGPMFPVIRWAMHRRDKKGVEIEAIKIAYEGFIFRPDNPTAKIKLARHLWNLGIHGHAYRIAESAIPGLPRQYFPDEHRMFGAWQMRPPAASSFDPIACAECGHANHAGNIHCAACGAKFLLLRVQGRSLPSAFGRRLLGGWLAMLLAIVGIPYASKLGGTAAIALIVAIVVAAIGALALAFRSAKELA